MFLWLLELLLLFAWRNDRWHRSNVLNCKHNKPNVCEIWLMLCDIKHTAHQTTMRCCNTQDIYRGNLMTCKQTTHTERERELGIFRAISYWLKKKNICFLLISKNVRGSEMFLDQMLSPRTLTKLSRIMSSRSMCVQLLWHLYFDFVLIFSFSSEAFGCLGFRHEIDIDSWFLVMSMIRSRWIVQHFLRQFIISLSLWFN